MSPPVSPPVSLTTCVSPPQVTETRTGPLGCSNYDNLDSVSSVLVQSPENKVQLQGRTGLVWMWGRTSAAVGCLWVHRGLQGRMLARDAASNFRAGEERG